MRQCLKNVCGHVFYIEGGRYPESTARYDGAEIIMVFKRILNKHMDIQGMDHVQAYGISIMFDTDSVG